MDSNSTETSVSVVAGVEERSVSEPATGPSTEVTAKPVRRRLTAKYKRWVVEEAEKLRTSREMGAFLRRAANWNSELGGADLE